MMEARHEEIALAHVEPTMLKPQCIEDNGGCEHDSAVLSVDEGEWRKKMLPWKQRRAIRDYGSMGRSMVSLPAFLSLFDCISRH